MATFAAGPDGARERIEAAERCSRQLADSCDAAWAVAHPGAGAHSRVANLIKDCSFIASSAARLLAHCDEHHPRVVAMQIAVARRVARRLARVCWEQPSAPLLACAGAARHAIEAYDDVMKLLWDASRRHGPSDTAELERDESVSS